MENFYCNNKHLMLKAWRFCLLLFVGLFFAYACQPQSDSETKKGPISPFFDLEAYFQEEINRLQQQQMTITKTIHLDGKEEKQTLDSLNFEEELSIFTQSAINRPAWLDKYQVDSTFSANQLASIQYEALTDRLKTRSIRITFSNGKVQNVAIENLLETVIATTNQQLNYSPAKGYSIRNSQEIAFSKSQEVKIEVQFEE